jgi:hypothetical protein
MTKILYLDCYSGVSGDMLLGALLDAGAPFEELERVVESLGLDGVSIARERVDRAGIGATKFRVADRAGEQDRGHGGQHAHPDHDHHEHDQNHGGHEHAHGHQHHHHHDHPHAAGGGRHHHRGLSEITAIVGRAALPEAARTRAVGLFRRLAEVEAGIHGVPVEQVHLHEVGAIDSIVDITLAVAAMEWLAPARVVASPLNVGSGTVVCEHGELPVPAPATVELLAGVPVYAQGPPVELVTPTGALLVTAYADAYGPLPPMRVGRIGYGAGDRDLPARPNVLRALVGETDEAGVEVAATERVVVLECEIDDMNPQLYGVLMERLTDAGALDVFYAPIQMKKNRPGTLVTVVASPARRDVLTGLLFAESTTIGVRVTETARERLDREMVTVETALGPVRVKVARRGGAVVNAAPEFEDCARLAAERGMPVKTAQALAMRAWLDTDK